MSLVEKIINELRQNPLDSYRKIASRLNTTPSTVSRKLSELREKGMRINFTCSFIPEILSLTRFAVFYDVSNFEQAEKTIKAVRSYNYVRSYNRIFGKTNRILVYFDIPERVSGFLHDFNEFLVAKKICESYSVHRSLGHTHTSKTLFPTPFSEVNIPTEDLRNYFLSFQKSSKILPEKPEALKLKELTPIFFYILEILQKNVRTKPSEILDRELFLEIRSDRFDNFGKGQYIEEGDSTIENHNHLFDEVEKYLFTSSKSKKTLLVDLNRKFHYILDKVCHNYRLSFSRTHFMEYTTRLYIFNQTDKSKAFQLYNYIIENPPPFNINMNLLEDISIFRVTLPHLHDAILNRTIWNTFPSCETYALDFYGWYGFHFHLYPSNFDHIDGNWRTDEYWMYECPIKELKMKKLI